MVFRVWRGAICHRGPWVLVILAGLAGALFGQDVQKSDGQRGATPLTPEQVLRRRQISDLQLSPDEKTVAFVVSEPIKGADQRRTIWLYDLSRKQANRFTTSEKTDSQPRFSPDGKDLAFLSNRDGKTQIYLIPLGGGEAQAVTQEKVGVQAFAWSPDGKRIAFMASPPASDEEEKKLKDKDDARVIGRDEKNARLWLLDVETRKARPLAEGKWRISEFLWLPNGEEMAVVATDEPRQELFSERMFVVAANDGRMREIARPAGPFGGLKISPDGKTLAYTGSRGDGPSAHDLFLQPIAGGPARNLTASDLDRPVSSPVWMKDGNLVFFAASGFVRTLYRMSLEGKAEKIDIQPLPPSGGFVLGTDLLVFVADSSIQMPELWVRLGAGPAEKVTSFNKEWDDIPLIKPAITAYPSFDKVAIEAALFLPPGYVSGTRIPLAVIVHGGPTGAWTDNFNSWAQLLASRGYAVLCPNIRGSTGYGFAFMAMNRKDWGGADFKDVMAGVDFLVAKGIADPERLGIGGWSYGGYMAAWAVTQTNRFKASVSGAPMTDLALEYGSEAAGINAYDTWFLGTPYENLSLFTARSPVTYVKNVKTPTLILCGENDVTDPIAQCYQFYRGLTRYGTEAEFVAYPREGHGPREEKHQIDVLDRMIGWFEKYLKK